VGPQLQKGGTSGLFVPVASLWKNKGSNRLEMLLQKLNPYYIANNISLHKLKPSTGSNATRADTEKSCVESTREKKHQQRKNRVPCANAS
jgi:hypothetical protein